MQNHESDIRFREVQRFSQPWLWALLILSDLAVLLTFGYGMLEQLVWGRPWGDRPMSDAALFWTGAGTIGLALGTTTLMYSMRLITEVRPEGLYLRFFPFRTEVIRYPNISACEAVTYRPLRDYGGWGIRYGRKGRALNVSGDRGVQLTLAAGKSLLVGSRSADELAQAIKALARRR